MPASQVDDASFWIGNHLRSSAPTQPIRSPNNFDVVRTEGDFLFGGPRDHGQIRSRTWSETPDQKNLASAEDDSASPPDAEKNLPPAARVNRNDFALLWDKSE
jgi:hypothetical protein